VVVVRLSGVKLCWGHSGCSEAQWCEVVQEA